MLQCEVCLMAIYFFNTRFYESREKGRLDLISIGIVRLDDSASLNGSKVNVRTYYAVSNEFDEEFLSPWLKKNVIPFLGEPSGGRKSIEKIREDILGFIGDDPKPVFVSFFSDYDWVIFCQIFGTINDLPSHFPELCIGLQQIAILLGGIEFPKQSTPNNALNNAIHAFKCYVYLLKNFNNSKINLDLFNINMLAGGSNGMGQ